MFPGEYPYNGNRH